MAVRTYYASPRHRDDWLESWLELWDGKPGKSALLPGYGWIFGMGDGTCNVGLGILNTSAAFGKTDYKDLLRRWLDNTPEDWGFRSQNMITPVRGAALPMGFNRQPHYGRGLLLVGDAGGMINPSTAKASRTPWSPPRSRQPRWRKHEQGPGSPAAERALESYPTKLKAELGGYYTLGRAFVKLIGHPQVMRVCTTHGLPRRTLMRFHIEASPT